LSDKLSNMIYFGGGPPNRATGFIIRHTQP
jgi:hypothetical protein